MSTRYEWMHLPSVTFLPANSDVTTLEPADEDTQHEHLVEDGALLLSGDEVTVVTGSIDDLREWAEEILRVLQEASYAEEPWRRELAALVTKPAVHMVSVYDDLIEVSGTPFDGDEVAGTIEGSYDPEEVKQYIGAMPIEDRRGKEWHQP